MEALLFGLLSSSNGTLNVPKRLCLSIDCTTLSALMNKTNLFSQKILILDNTSSILPSQWTMNFMLQL